VLLTLDTDVLLLLRSWKEQKRKSWMTAKQFWRHSVDLSITVLALLSMALHLHRHVGLLERGTFSSAKERDNSWNLFVLIVETLLPF
jgi:hypothetical protein